MPRGGVDIQFTGVGANALNDPAIFVIIRASYGDIASAALTGVNFNYLSRCRYTDV